MIAFIALDSASPDYQTGLISWLQVCKEMTEWRLRQYLSYWFGWYSNRLVQQGRIRDGYPPFWYRDWNLAWEERQLLVTQVAHLSLLCALHE